MTCGGFKIPFKEGFISMFLGNLGQSQVVVASVFGLTPTLQNWQADAIWDSK